MKWNERDGDNPGNDVFGKENDGTTKLSIFFVRALIFESKGAVAPLIIPPIPEILTETDGELVGETEEDKALDTAETTLATVLFAPVGNEVTPIFAEAAAGDATMEMLGDSRLINYFPSWPGAPPPPTVKTLSLIVFGKLSLRSERFCLISVNELIY